MTTVQRLQYNAIAGLAAVMVGVGQGAVAFVDIAPKVTGGVVALLGAIYIIEQVDSAAGVSVSDSS
jgi:hypothetical protein